MTLKELSNELIKAKKIEAEAKTKILEIEQQILELADDASKINFNVSNFYSYQADPALLMMATMSWPAELQPAYLSPKIDDGRLEKIKVEMPNLWQQISHLVQIQYKQSNLSVCVE